MRGPTPLARTEGPPACSRPAPSPEAELISIMEKKGIGTDASISTHMNTIIQRRYILVALALALALAVVLVLVVVVVAVVLVVVVVAITMQRIHCHCHMYHLRRVVTGLGRGKRI